MGNLEQQSKTKAVRRKLKGVIVSDKMHKTVVVAVSRYKKHPKYKKYFKVTKRFKAHNEKSEFHAGDKVIIEESKPLSKEKNWVIVRKV